MRRLIFLLEEPSAEAMLRGVLPRILPEDCSPEFKVFEGKQDLERRLTRVLKAWRTPDCAFVVLRDQDSGDCHRIKHRLVELCRQSWRGDLPVVVRIACRELESFYLGDLSAVEEGLGVSGLAGKQNSRKFREPDKLGSPSRELERLTNGLYGKVAGSRAIAPHLNINDNRSHSFRVLVAGIRKLTTEAS